MPALDLRDLTTLEDFARVVDLEKTIWGLGTGDDAVPLPLFAVTVPRGAVLVGAYDGDRLVGFVYSLPVLHGKRLAHWSHMLGVLPAYRGAGIGLRLKLAQRDRVRALGLNLIEWTYDPLQALNAQLNVSRLGAVVHEYELNVYGSSSSPLHGELPTDRFVAEWWIESGRVEQRLGAAPHRPAAALATVPVVNPSVGGDRIVPGRADLQFDDAQIAVEIPVGFTELIAADPQLALEWRLHTREVFASCFARGYRVEEFLLDAGGRVGRYVLARRRTEA